MTSKTSSIMAYPLTWAIAFLLSCFSVYVSAQEDEPAENAFNDVEEIESFEELKLAFAKIQREHGHELRAARGDDRIALIKNRPKPTIYADLLTKFIAEEDNNRKRVEIIDWWIRFETDRNERRKIIGVVLEHLRETEFMAKYVARIGRSLELEQAKIELNSLIENNPFDSVKASAVFTLQATLGRTLRGLDGEQLETVEAEIAALRDLLRNDYAEVTDSRNVPYSAHIEALEFADKIQIGKPVPDIVGTDIDGVEFNLSDYRGKVTVIDFWGDW